MLTMSVGMFLMSKKLDFTTEYISLQRSLPEIDVAINVLAVARVTSTME